MLSILRETKSVAHRLSLTGMHFKGRERMIYDMAVSPLSLWINTIIIQVAGNLHQAVNNRFTDSDVARDFTHPILWDSYTVIEGI